MAADSSDFFEEGAARVVRSGSARRYRSGTPKRFPSRSTAHDCTSSFADTAVSADRRAFPFAVSRFVRDRVFYVRQERDIKNHLYAVLLRRGIAYEDGIFGLKRRREALRELHLPEIDRGLEMLHHLDTACAGLDRAIHEEFLKSTEAQLLESIPGIGELTAIALVAELCPIDRFPNIEKLCSYAGLVPTNHQSGETSYQGHLKKDSNPVVKWLLVEASWTHRRYDTHSDVSKVAKRVSRRRGKQKGNVAGAHKLLKIVYAVLKRGTPYSPERPSSGPNTAESKTAASP